MPPPVQFSDDLWDARAGYRSSADALTKGPATFVAAGPRGREWWLWPHLLGLDAPLVAVTWQMWWASLAGIELAWPQYAILGLAVWMLYLADRLADVRSAEPTDFQTDRHRFFARNKTAMRLLLAGVLGALVVLSPSLLPPRQFRGGLGLLAATAIYYWMIHHSRRRLRPRVPKEAVVGALFSLGSGFFVATAAPGDAVQVWCGLVLFGTLCFLNCALISSWEQTPQDMGEPASILNAFPRLTTGLGRAALLLAGAVLMMASFAHSGVFLPVAVGALGLWLLDRLQARISARALRCLADFVLLAPWLGVFCRSPFH